MKKRGLEPSRRDSDHRSHRAQLIWTLIVAVGVAIVALQQAANTTSQSTPEILNSGSPLSLESTLSNRKTASQ